MAQPPAPQLQQPPPHTATLQQGMAILQTAVAKIDSDYKKQLKQMQEHKEMLEQSCAEKKLILDEEHAQRMYELRQRGQRLQAERDDMEADKQRFLKSQVDIDEIVDQQDPITLEVGGEKFRTQRATLLKREKEHSIFPRLLKTLQERSPGKGSIFIDRDKKHFNFILNYMRQGKEVMKGTALNPKHTDDLVLNEIIAEAQYYQLPTLVKLLELRRISSTKKPQDMQTLNREGIFTTQIPPHMQPKGGPPYKYKTSKDETSLNSKNLSGIVFDHVLFSKISFQRCILHQAVFRGCTFRDLANFQDADLDNARFDHCQGLDYIYKADRDGVEFIPQIPLS